MNMRRSLFLQEMGYAPIWRSRAVPAEPAAEAVGAAAMTTPASPVMIPTEAGAAAAPGAASIPASAAAAPVAARRVEPVAPAESAWSDELPPIPVSGTIVAAATDAPAASASSAHEPAADPAPISSPAPASAQPLAKAAPTDTAHPASSAPDLASLQQLASQCTACPRSRGRKNSVTGSGDPHPAWLVVADAPAPDDEAAAQPFAGKPGELLDNMLAAVGKGRQTGVYLTHLVKCCARDEQGFSRPPDAAEIAACRPFLVRQLQLLQPKLVLALGKTAALALRQPGATQTPLRGVVHALQDTDLPLVATWHPQHLLQQPQEKRQVWADLCLASQASQASQAAHDGHHGRDGQDSQTAGQPGAPS